MPASNYELKSRIKSIDTIRKITRAMKLVATAKLQRTKKALVRKEEYFQTNREIILEVLKDGKNNIFNKTFANHLQNDKKLFILINSQIGFCAGFNSNINKNFIKDFRIDKDDVVLYGKKGVSYLKRENIKPVYFSNLISDYFLIEEIQVSISEIYRLFQENKYSEIVVYYNHFINSVNVEPRKISVWPINSDELLIEDNKEKSTDSIIFEPSEKEVAIEVFPMYLQVLIYSVLVNSKVSVNALRRTAMESATDNANDLINDLTLKANRIRQSIVTQEIAEIVSGASAGEEG